MAYTDKNNPVLVVGADGIIGHNLAMTLENVGAVVWTTTRKKESVSDFCFFIDLADDIKNITLPNIKFSVVFFCVAVTSIYKCETEPGFTREVNVTNTVNLITKLVHSGSFVVFLSSNVIFNGKIPFIKLNETADPKNEYGKQKAETENLLLDIGSEVAIVRLNKVVSPQAHIFNSWINDLKAGKTIYPFYDMFMAPISLNYTTQVLLRIADNRVSGITQVSADNDISYATAAHFFAKKINAAEYLIKPISYTTVGIKFSPKHTTFDGSTLKALGFEPPQPLRAFDEYNI